MSPFKRKCWTVAVLIGLGAAISGCANTEYYKALGVALEQQGKLDVEREKTRQAKAQADASRADAIKAGMARSEIAATVGVAVLGAADIVKESGGAGARDFKAESANPIFALLKPPEDLLDKGIRLLRAVTGGAAELASASSPWLLAREAGRTTRSSYDRDVALEGQRQTGETSRITAIAGRGPSISNVTNTTNNTSTTNTAGRDQAVGGALTHTECSSQGGGTGANGTTGTTGTQPATGGSAGSSTNNC